MTDITPIANFFKSWPIPSYSFRVYFLLSLKAPNEDTHKLGLLGKLPGTSSVL